MALRRLGAALVTLALAAAALVPLLRGDESRGITPGPTPAAQAALAQLPLAFAPDGGGYMAAHGGLRVDLGARGTDFSLNGRSVLRARFAGAHTSRPVPERRLPGVINVYRGPRSEWRTNIPTFERVRYSGLYPGIDAIFHGRSSRLEYDFVVAPGADPSRIALDLRGADSIKRTPSGGLSIRSGKARLDQLRPVAYQQMAGRRVPVDASFRLDGHHIGFDLGGYDRSKPLVIDPILSYSSFLGGAGGDQLKSIARGPDGTIHVAGLTSSNNFPGASRASRPDIDAIVTKLSADGSSLVYSNLYGGSTHDTSTVNGDDEAYDIAVDGAGNAFVVGSTGSTDFPQISDYDVDLIGACNTAAREGFLLMITAAGDRSYSSCFGGNSDDYAYGVAVTNPGGNSLARVAISGYTNSTNSWGSPTIGSGADDTPNGADSFLAEVNVASINKVNCDPKPVTDRTANVTPCYSMRYRTFLAASRANAVAYDSSGYAYITGYAAQFFQATDGSPQPGANATNMLLAKIDPGTAGSTSLKYALHYGVDGSEVGNGIALDSAGNIYVAGEACCSNSSWPAAETGSNLAKDQGTDGLIVKFSPVGAILRTTYVGGPGEDSLDDIALQENNGVVAQYVVGTTSGMFPTHNPIAGQSCNSDAIDTQILVVKRIDGSSPSGQVISCLGGAPNSAGSIQAIDEGHGIAVSPTATDGTILVSGWTRGTNWTTTGNGFQKTYGGTNTGPDGVIAKITQVGVDAITATPPALLGNAPAHFAFTTSEAIGFACNAPDGTQHLVAGGPRTAAACGGGPVGEASYSGLADGSHTFEVSTADGVNSQSAALSHTFTVDATPPQAFDLVAPDDNAGVTSTRPVLKWNQTSDPHGVTYDLVMDGAAADWLEPPVCATGVCSGRPDAPLINGDHKWKVRAKDTADPANVRESATRTVKIGNPVNAVFTIAPNPVLAGGKVTFDGSGTNDATHSIDRFEWDLDGDGTYETDTGRTPTASRSYPTPGTVTVRMRVHDEVNNLTTESAPQDVRINSPSFATQVGVSINGGAQYTNKPDVKLAIVAPSNTTSFLIANDGGFVGALPQAPDPEIAWRLDSSGPERLPKTVYVRFLLNTFASPNYTDDIILDERPPVVDTATVVGDAGAASIARLRTFKVKVKAHDTNSGVGFVQVTTNKKKPGKLIAYKKTVKAKLATRPKFLRARDRAGNFSGWKKLR